MKTEYKYLWIFKRLILNSICYLTKDKITLKKNPFNLFSIGLCFENVVLRKIMTLQGNNLKAYHFPQNKCHFLFIVEHTWIIINWSLAIVSMLSYLSELCLILHHHPYFEYSTTL